MNFELIAPDDNDEYRNFKMEVINNKNELKELKKYPVVILKADDSGSNIEPYSQCSGAIHISIIL